MANCSDNVYVIKYTDKSKGTITITKSSLVTNLVDIALVGKSRLDYGEVFNENILHLLENFACPSLAGNADAPDTAVAFGSLLTNPIDGQKWFNSTNKRLYLYNASLGEWVAQAKQGDVAGNSGIIAHGSFLPRPVGADGYVFPYSECSFVVSQHSSKSIPGVSDSLPSDTEIDYMRCYVGSDGQVTVQFRYRGESSLRNGYANYQIIGIRGETNTPLISVTPLPIPSPTPGVSATMTPTPTPTPTPSSSVAVTPTSTPAASVAPSPTRSPTPTPTVSLTRTVTPTPTPSPSSVYTIDLSGIPTYLDHATGSVASWVSLDFNADGTWIAKEKFTTVGSGVWAPSGIGNNYELRIDDQSGNYPQGDVGVWYSLGSGFQFYVGDSDQGTSANENVTYTIRRKGTTGDAQTRTLQMLADGECFAVGTKLAAAGGYLNVEDLAVGDEVVSFSHATMIDESEDNWRDWKTTDNNFVLGSSTVTAARRFYADGGMDINGIITTKNHIHFVFDGAEFGWKNACNVLPTDKLVDVDGNLVDILNITELTDRIEFVALDVETDDTLVIVNNDKLILGHNISA